MQKAAPGPGGAPVVLAHREAHCPALPDIWPVRVPAAGSSERFIVRLIEPEGPLTTAPMSEPLSAVTCPVEDAEGDGTPAHRDAAVLGRSDDA